MKHILKYFSLLLFFVAALVLVQRCSDDDENNVREPLAGYEGDELKLVKGFAGNDGNGKTWTYTSFLRNGNATTEWAGFKVEFKLLQDNNVDANRHVLSFVRVSTPPALDSFEDEDVDSLWPPEGSFKLGGTTVEVVTGYVSNIGATRHGAPAVTDVQLVRQPTSILVTFTVPGSGDFAGKWAMNFDEAGDGGDSDGHDDDDDG